jgi:predicted RNA-binding Zn ribbon-like protein
MSGAVHADAHIHTTDRQLCLDFVNTASNRISDTPTERLKSYDDLVAWGEAAGSLTAATAAQLRGQAARQPEQAAAVLRRAIDLRETLYRIFQRVIEGALPQNEDLTRLNAELGIALANLRLEPNNECCAWAWVEDSRDPAQMLWPVVRSAAELLTAGELDRIRQCANESCGWLFIDRSKNRSRRWCDMSECGNVAKVRRYRQRHQA